MTPEQVITIILIAVGLAMDCFAVSITRGITIKRNRTRNALLIAFSFGLFQAVMPVLGWFAGESFINLIKDVDHWIAFGLLAVIGGKMILESRKSEEEKDGIDLSIPVLLTLSVATSIDAFAVGLTIAFLEMPIYYAAAVIGITSFVLSLIGFYIGKKAGKLLGSRMEAVGGIILIGIGLKILIEHLTN